MQILIRVKAVGKRRDVLEKMPYDVPEGIKTATELITYIVKENVRVYNEKSIDASILPYLTQTEYEQGEHIGKIGFGDRKNERMQEESEAVKNALQCYKDGIYRVIINETEIHDDGHIELKENDTVTFIRLVMLAGRLW